MFVPLFLKDFIASVNENNSKGNNGGACTKALLQALLYLNTLCESAGQLDPL
jgi:hypothetical protein